LGWRSLSAAHWRSDGNEILSSKSEQIYRMNLDAISADDDQNRQREPRRSISAAGLLKALTQPAILALLWSAVLAHIWTLFETMHGRVYRWDFSLYYLGSYAQRHDVDPYTADLTALAHRLGLEPGLRVGNFDPPTMIIAMEPLTWMSVPAAYWTWIAINVLALALAFLLLLSRPPSMDRRYLLAWLALALIYPPLGTHFYYAQSQIVALLMLVLIMRWTERRHPAAAGITLGVLSILRTYPLALGGYFLFRRNWRALVYAAIAVMVCVAMTIVAAGVEPWRSFLQQINVPTMDDYTEGPANVALVQIVKLLFALVIGNGPQFALRASRLAVAALANLVIVVLTIKVTIDSWDRPDEEWRVYSLWVVTMMVVSPVTWFHSLLLLILPFAKLALAAANGRASQRAIWMATASYLMVSLASGWHQRVGSFDASRVSAWIAELSPLSLLVAYIAVYWFATDREPSSEKAVTSA
jgi:alpha-1,2-mannosyltransferase